MNKPEFPLVRSDPTCFPTRAAFCFLYSWYLGWTVGPGRTKREKQGGPEWSNLVTGRTVWVKGWTRLTSTQPNHSAKVADVTVVKRPVCAVCLRSVNRKPRHRSSWCPGTTTTQPSHSGSRITSGGIFNHRTVSGTGNSGLTSVASIAATSYPEASGLFTVPRSPQWPTLNAGRIGTGNQTPLYPNVHTNPPHDQQ